MSAYPAFFQLRDSAVSFETGSEVARASNGALRIRHMWSADKPVVDVGHVLTAAQRATLDAFYAANRDLTVSFKLSETGQVFDAMFSGPPQYKKVGSYFEARVRLLGV